MNNDQLMIEELARVPDLLRIGRAYGFTVTATPMAIYALLESTHPSASMILANVCPVDADPCTEARKRA